MKNLLLLFTFIFSCSILIAQPQFQSALDFDGVDDEVVVPNAGALIAGSSELSMSCWVKPMNNAPSFPDFDGFIGFRDDVQADFYIVQLTATNYEIRYRNNIGLAYTMTASNLQVGTWQLLTVTYDGNLLRLYRDAVFIDSTQAAGLITNQTASFRAGNLQYSFNNFNLLGQLDEVGLWNRKLNADEIQCMYNGQISTQSPGLMIYLDLNEGQPGADNTAIALAEDQSNHIPGNLNGFTMNGNNSNYVDGVNHFTLTGTASVCTGGSLPLGNQMINEPGIWYVAFPVTGDCDSLVVVTVSSLGPDTTVTWNGTILTAATADSYQWYDCTAGVAIAGETGQTYAYTNNGVFACIVTQGSCTDTSNCHQVALVNAPLQTPDIGKIYPNPVTDLLTITWAESTLTYNWQIFDVSGDLVMTGKSSGATLQVDTRMFANGIYLMMVNDGSTGNNLRFIKH